MSLSENFPHRLALLQVALRARKLKICEILQDPAELAVISSLMIFLDNRDFRTPITVPRKVIGQYSMLGRTTLYEKLATLEQRSLIERYEGERAIRFTEYGASLLSLYDEKPEMKPKTEKKSFFRVGTSSFPKEVIPLLTRGLSERQVGWLMAEAKKAKVRIQDQMAKFGKIIDKYEGKLLFLVFRDFMRKPEKYQPKPAAKTVKQDFTGNQIKLLQLLSSHAQYAISILRPVERVDFREGLWTFSTPEVCGGAPQPMTSELLAQLEDRLACISRKALATQGEPIQIKIKAGTFYWGGEEVNGRPIARSAKNSSPLELHWGNVYSVLPDEYQHWSFLFDEQEVDSRQGASFVRKGVNYVIEFIESGRAWLTARQGARSWSENIEARLLEDASIQWL